MCSAAMGLSGRDRRMDECSDSRSTIVAAQRVGQTKYVARTDAESCSEVKTGWKLCGLT